MRRWGGGGGGGGGEAAPWVKFSPHKHKDQSLDPHVRGSWCGRHLIPTLRGQRQASPDQGSQLDQPELARP